GWPGPLAHSLPALSLRSVRSGCAPLVVYPLPSCFRRSTTAVCLGRDRESALARGGSVGLAVPHRNDRIPVSDFVAPAKPPPRGVPALAPPADSLAPPNCTVGMPARRCTVRVPTAASTAGVVIVAAAQRLRRPPGAAPTPPVATHS